MIALPVGVYILTYIPWAFAREPPALPGLAGLATPARPCST